ncbi:hypothetical protein [Jiangella endophytica]|uniref:hypothetical protein n=1 Tax=Jiangella endophytica TaxID=1623398 RepID=UPI000E3430D9|nr:hypothetical protein [Jiangella endophytica]
MTPARAVVSALGAAGVVLTAAACSGESEEPTGLTTSTGPAETADPTPTEDPAVADVEAAYARYWEVLVASENGLDETYEPLVSIMSDALAQRQVADIRGLAEDGVTRDGAPDVGVPEVSVDGDTARVQSCVDETPWNVYYNEQLVPQETGIRARVIDFERIADEWIVVDLVDQSEATISC